MTDTIDTLIDERVLATVRTVSSIEQIEGADRIEIAKVDGWRAIVGKDQFQVGDEGVFFEINSLLPVSDPRFAELAPRGTRILDDGTEVHRLKSSKMQGIYSQGLLLPLDRFTADELVGDIAANVGVTKLIETVPEGEKFAGPFPEGVQRSHAERTQNLSVHWAVLCAEQWVATEKIDGESTTVANIDGVFTVSSRRWAITEGDNSYWRAVRNSGLDQLVEDGMVVQGESYGPGIGKNTLQVKDVTIAVFSVARMVDGQAVTIPRSEWSCGLLALAAPIYDMELQPTVDETVEMVERLKSLISPKLPAEGIVWHHATAKTFAVLNDRSTIKTISNRYASKHDN